MITLVAHALNRVVQCNGSVYMDPSEVPDEDEQSEDRREGIAAHWLALEVIAGRFSDPVELVDRKAPNGVWITPEMAEHVEPFIADVRGRVGAVIHTEETVDFRISGETFIACRLDLATWEPVTGTLTIDEFKYGYRIIEPQRNWQLAAEAMGWCSKHGIQPKRIILNVHQPRPHHADGKKRSWELNTPHEYAAVFGELVDNLTTLSRTLNTGPNCYKCPALSHCEAVKRASYNTIDASGRVFNDKMNDDELAFQFENIDAAISRATQLRDAYKELLTHRINSGHVFQNHAFEPVFGNTRFKKGTTPAMLSAVSGVKVEKLTKTEPLTPAQMIKAGASELIVKAFTERPPAGVRLVKKSAAQRAAAMFKPPTE